MSNERFLAYYKLIRDAANVERGGKPKDMTQAQKWLLVSAARSKEDAIKAVEASREVLTQHITR